MAVSIEQRCAQTCFGATCTADTALLLQAEKVAVEVPKDTATVRFELWTIAATDAQNHLTTLQIGFEVKRSALISSGCF